MNADKKEKGCSLAGHGLVKRVSKPDEQLRGSIPRTRARRIVNPLIVGGCEPGGRTGRSDGKATAKEHAKRTSQGNSFPSRLSSRPLRLRGRFLFAAKALCALGDLCG
jgi:hypothetical protein